jgi:hypothetical protein
MMMNDSGDGMTDMIKEGLCEAGHSDLAADVVLGPNGRPMWNWQKLDRAPSREDVHAVHTAMLRAYEAHAPDEIGEEANQFTRSPASWWQAIVHHQRRSRRRPPDCPGDARGKGTRHRRMTSTGTTTWG